MRAKEVFNERVKDIQSFMDLLGKLDDEIRHGTPRLLATEETISPQQIRIMQSSVYLLLYNLVECTITRCLDEVTEQTLKVEEWLVEDLNPLLRREWIRTVARTHTDLTPDKRLDHALELCEALLKSSRIAPFKLEKGGGGNWDYGNILKVSNRIGINLKFRGRFMEKVNPKPRHKSGVLETVKKRRNDLAHGSISFVECANELTHSELQDLVDTVVEYLSKVVNAFEGYIRQRLYLNDSGAVGVHATVP